MRVTEQVVVFDAADIGTESAFWAGLLDGTVEPYDPPHTWAPSRALRVSPPRVTT